MADQDLRRLVEQFATEPCAEVFKRPANNSPVPKCPEIQGVERMCYSCRARQALASQQALDELVREGQEQGFYEDPSTSNAALRRVVSWARQGILATNVGDDALSAMLSWLDNDRALIQRDIDS